MKLENLIQEIAGFVSNSRGKNKASVNLELYNGRIKLRAHPISFKRKNDNVAIEDCKIIDINLHPNGKLVTEEVDLTENSDTQVAELLIQSLQKMLSVQT
ncbi:hypothetical protein [Shewanella algidipiscicola]|uniref:Uncharacterized protein n=1 Tax=Shewanella algidipiscicola TaxID=614070 RepID=A0ABQ4NTI6_9GAMM|nr:hypothetical protein [Shewanella algidipiscicola]GIU03104.1 hypothetical protein TUM4630_36220 [Shewanella algidipiscicola]